MIKYDRLWKTMEKRKISQYALYTFYNIDRSLLDRFRKNKNVEIFTIDRLCTILNCNIEDIVEHVPDEPENPPEKPDSAEDTPEMPGSAKDTPESPDSAEDTPGSPVTPESLLVTR